MRKVPTIQDLADALGMHKSTVSEALSGKGTIAESTRERVRLAARELGYSPNQLAQRLAHGQQNSMICLICDVLDVGLATEKILRIQKSLNRLGYEVPIYNCPESRISQIRQICRQRPQAIICATPFTNFLVFQELEMYQRNGGLVISYDSPVPLDCDQVIFDREDNSYQGAQYLLENGHRNIGLGLSNTTTWAYTPREISQPTRLQGFQRACDEFGVTVRPDWLFAATTYEQGGSEMARQFLALSERPTGVCIVNDYVALAFMVEVRRAGVRVPEDLSIIGHDNQSIASYCPVPLTSVTHPVDEIVSHVVTLVEERLNGFQSAPRRVVLQGELIVRDSVARVSE